MAADWRLGRRPKPPAPREHNWLYARRADPRHKTIADIVSARWAPASPAIGGHERPSPADSVCYVLDEDGYHSHCWMKQHVVRRPPQPEIRRPLDPLQGVGIDPHRPCRH